MVVGVVKNPPYLMKPEGLITMFTGVHHWFLSSFTPVNYKFYTLFVEDLYFYVGNMCPGLATWY